MCNIEKYKKYREMHESKGPKEQRRSELFFAQAIVTVMFLLFFFYSNFLLLDLPLDRPVVDFVNRYSLYLLVGYYSLLPFFMRNMRFYFIAEFVSGVTIVLYGLLGFYVLMDYFFEKPQAYYYLALIYILYFLSFTYTASLFNHKKHRNFYMKGINYETRIINFKPEMCGYDSLYHAKKFKRISSCENLIYRILLPIIIPIKAIGPAVGIVLSKSFVPIAFKEGILVCFFVLYLPFINAMTRGVYLSFCNLRFYILEEKRLGIKLRLY